MVRQYCSEDYKDLYVWHLARGITPPPREALSSFGLLSHGVAAGFLYRTDSCIAFVDVYVSNPEATFEERDKALDDITIGLCNKAKELGYKYVKCETKLTIIEARAKRLGFTDVGQFRCLVKEL